MNTTRILLVTTGVIGLCLSLAGEPAAPQDAKRGKLLYLTLSAGFKHKVIPYSTEVVTQIGKKSGDFDTTVTGDLAPFTAEDLKHYDAVMFYTTGELPMNDEQKKAFVDFVRSGHGFVGVHSATDTFYMWKDYADIIGGCFNGHPWHQQVTIDVADPASGLVSFLAPSFQVNDEIYQIDDFNPETSHVLLRLDPASVDVTKPGARQKWYGWPVAWTRMDRKGRMFYCSLGHEHDVWADPRYQQLLLNGIKWAMGK